MKPGDLIKRDKSTGYLAGDILTSNFELAGVRFPYVDVAIIIQHDTINNILHVLWNGKIVIMSSNFGLEIIK
jgi:hypothetical protein